MECDGRRERAGASAASASEREPRDARAYEPQEHRGGWMKTGVFG